MAEAVTKRRSWFTFLFLLATGIVPVLGLANTPPDTMLLAYSLFALLALMFRAPLTRSAIVFVVAALGFGLVIEFLAWLGHFSPAIRYPCCFIRNWGRI
ncbi:MAG: hypothetical protein AAGG69_09375 [Pseudomonadota bacterium]